MTEMLPLLMLAAIVLYGVLWLTCLVMSRTTGYSVGELMKMPSFSTIRSNPGLARASHKAYGIALGIATFAGMLYILFVMLPAANA